MFEGFEELNDDNFVLFAAKYYDNPQSMNTDEFYEDLNRFKYLKKLFNRYEQGDLQERLILNHIIVLSNIFGVRPAVLMLYFKLAEKHHNALRTFLVYLNYIVDTDESPFDPIIVEALREM
mgnify:FL=1